MALVLLRLFILGCQLVEQILQSRHLLVQLPYDPVLLLGKLEDLRVEYRLLQSQTV